MDTRGRRHSILRATTAGTQQAANFPHPLSCNYGKAQEVSHPQPAPEHQAEAGAGGAAAAGGTPLLRQHIAVALLQHVTSSLGHRSALSCRRHPALPVVHSFRLERVAALGGGSSCACTGCGGSRCCAVGLALGAQALPPLARLAGCKLARRLVRCAGAAAAGACIRPAEAGICRCLVRQHRRQGSLAQDGCGAVAWAVIRAALLAGCPGRAAGI